MYARFSASNARVRAPWGRYVHKHRFLRLRELQDLFPAAWQMPVTPIRPWRPRQPHPFGLRRALLRQPDGKQRP